jgi:hypothetical protein
MVFSEASVAASTMNALPTTPAAPFEVMRQIKITVISCQRVRCLFVACAMNRAAMVR